MINDDSSELSDTEAQNALEVCIGQVRRNVPNFFSKQQNHSSINNFYPTCENDQWTCGFWCGELWLSYLKTGEATFKDAANAQVKSMEERIENKIAVDHHDMGFLYSPSCVASWILTKDKDSHSAALKAAKQLLSRYQEKGHFIQAWGKMGEAQNYRYIIDCLLNTPLLYWASRETGDETYSKKAREHTATCIKNSIRSDGSTYHTFFMDINTGSPIRGETCQGYSNDSVWARGQAWGVYGTALALRHDFHSEYKETFQKTLDFFLSRLPSDNVPYWDMIFNDQNALHDGETEPRDSSAAAIVVCGILERISQLKNENSSLNDSLLHSYEHIARVILKSLVGNYSVKDAQKSNGLLLHGTYSKKSPFNTCTPEGVDECVSWGDYFYMEALTRLLNPAWESFW